MYLKKCFCVYKNLTRTALCVAFILSVCLCRFYYGGLSFYPFEKDVLPVMGKASVMVMGAVEEPGVYEVDRLSRVGEAVNLAKPSDGADIASLNLAEYVEDGQSIKVPFKGARPSAGELININTANEGQLCTLPGIGPAIAKRIILHRTTEGPFTQIENITCVNGIGTKVFAAIKDLITI